MLNHRNRQIQSQGSRRSITPQPLSVSGSVGVKLALGVAGLTPRSVH
jgi:hypothetical protein